MGINTLLLVTVLFFCWCVSSSLQVKFIMFSFPSNCFNENSVIEYFMLALLPWQRMQVKQLFLYFGCFGIWQHKMTSFTHMHSIITGCKILNITKVNKYCISLHPAAFSHFLSFILPPALHCIWWQQHRLLSETSTVWSWTCRGF